MLHIDRLTLHNFKSFKHANIRFGQGFNCILGPNTSGKSNICDALLFVLGETSLRRLRIGSFAEAINMGAKPKEDGTKRAYVQVMLTGETPIEIARIIKSNNKIGYRLNGKRVTRQEVLDALRAYSSGISEVNTITQDEIRTLTNLNAKERRELIDVAAGIKDFEEKKKAAEAELEKVHEKIGGANNLLGERLGYLKELERQKQDAEKYIALDKLIRSSEYTIVTLRQGEVEAQFKASIDALEAKQAKRAELDSHKRELEDGAVSLEKERSALTKEMTARSAEISAVNSRRESVESALAVAETKLKVAEESAASFESRASSLKKEIDEKSASLASDASRLSEQRLRLGELEAELRRTDTSTDAGMAKLVGDYGALQAELEKRRREHAEAEKQATQAELRATELTRTIESRRQALEQLKSRLADLDGKISEKSAASKEASKSVSEAKAALAGAQKELENARVALSKLGAEISSVRAELASRQEGSDAAARTLKRELGQGFYGRAADLCAYDDKYATAVQASAGARLNYFIVDSIDVADRAVGVLKAKGLGRASFIPIKEIRSQGGGAEEGMVPLISLVQFDSRFRSAFEYIFSNTYLVDSITGSKGKALGRSRLVTIDGELLEQSGLVTGGTFRAAKPIGMLEKRRKELEAEMSSLQQRLSTAEDAESKARATLGRLEVSELEASITIKGMGAEAESMRASIAKESAELVRLETERDQAAASYKGLAAKASELAKGVADLAPRSDSLYAMINSVSAAAGGAAKLDMKADTKGLRDEVSRTREAIASLSTQCEMTERRLVELKQELESALSGARAQKELASRLREEMEQDRVAQRELQTQIESHDKRSGDMLKKVRALEEQASQLSEEKGKTMAALERIVSDIAEINATRGQLSTRLADIKAQLASYASTESPGTMSGKTVKELEAERDRARAEQAALGTVNLKAIEMYEEKSRDVTEAKERLETLERERTAVLQMIGEIDTKREQIFRETFDKVNENFKALYAHISTEGVTLALEDQTKPFESGLVIKSDTGKPLAPPFTTRSGGEKALFLLTLLFAIQMMRPMAFYIFDEIDSSLDKVNSKKLSSMIREMGKSSQFVVVSHNDTLITSADTAIGVSKQGGVSSVVGLQIAPKGA